MSCENYDTNCTLPGSGATSLSICIEVFSCKPKNKWSCLLAWFICAPFGTLAQKNVNKRVAARSSKARSLLQMEMKQKVYEHLPKRLSQVTLPDEMGTNWTAEAHVGLTASTGQLSDNHDVVRLETFVSSDAALKGEENRESKTAVAIQPVRRTCSESWSYILVFVAVCIYVCAYVCTHICIYFFLQR